MYNVSSARLNRMGYGDEDSSRSRRRVHEANLEHFVVVVAMLEHNLTRPRLEERCAERPHVNGVGVPLANHCGWVGMGGSL